MGEGIENKREINYEIPLEGSLGLLALGHVGLELWRRKRKEMQEDGAKKDEV